MYLQNHLNIDSVKAVQDSIKAVQESELMHSVGFDITKIGSSEIILTVLGYGIVFLALLILYLFLANLTKLITSARKRKLKAEGKHTSDNELTISGETAAAISMAITLHFREVHDFENTVITIKKVQSAYSPWNSKLYGLRQNPKY
jgi:sodium pump decarboxylase gamma subunit